MIHLHLHSSFSLLSGAATVGQLVERGKALGQRALALTDDNGLYAGVAFYKACRETGIKPLLGVDLRAQDGRAVLLARDSEGYQTLCRLITARHQEPDFTLIEHLPQACEHLFILTRDPELLQRLAALNREGRGELPPVWALVERFDTPESRANVRRIVQTAQSLDIPLVAANDIHFVEPEDHPIHLALRAIDEGVTLQQVEEGLTLPRQAPCDAYFKSPGEMRALFSDLPAALENTERIADACNVELPLGQTEFPRFPLPEGESAFSYLWKLCFEGARERYRPLTPRVTERLTYELSVIEERNLAAYFLVVWDIVRFCREQEIPCVGRGSAADSLVSYALGITHGCPIQHDLYFERFLNRERKGAPDIDLDLCWRRRDEVLDYVYRKYGGDRVAMICTYSTFCARSALREVAKAFGLPAPEIRRLAKALPHYGSLARLEEERAALPESRHVRFDEALYRQILDIARRLDGFPRHLSTHACGIVVSPRPLTDKVPLQIAAKGLQITQYDMYGVEDVGLLKIDLLGVRALSVMADVTRAAREKYGQALNLNGLPPQDEGTYRRINEGRTLGCFQLESPGMRQLLQKLNVDCLETIIASISVIRPGPNDAGMMRHYVARHNGKEPVSYLDPRLEPILKSTSGILLYQEDVLKIASVVAGMTLGEADVFRRAMTKLRTPENMEANRKRFVEGAVAGGASREVALELWRQVAGFAGYAFCKAHSVSYGILAYQSAYLKQHFPAEFMAATINNGGGFYSTAVYVEEARRLGLKILPPDINESDKDFTSGPGWLRVGLARVKQLSENSLDAILRARRDGRFTSLNDLYQRARVPRLEWENLIRCGALDSLGESRPQLLWRLDLLARGREAKRPRDKGLFGQVTVLGSGEAKRETRNAIPRVQDLSVAEKLRWEQELLDFTVTMHPVEYLRSLAGPNGWTKVQDLSRHAGRRVKILGVVRTAKRTRTKQGEWMKFVTLEDETGLVDVVLFPGSYQRWGHALPFHRYLVIAGRVQDDVGSVTIVGERVEPIQRLRPSSRPYPSRSAP